MRKREASHVREAIEKWLYLFIYLFSLLSVAITSKLYFILV